MLKKRLINMLNIKRQTETPVTIIRAVSEEELLAYQKQQTANLEKQLYKQDMLNKTTNKLG